jgi:hypothetical protein
MRIGVGECSEFEIIRIPGIDTGLRLFIFIMGSWPITNLDSNQAKGIIFSSTWLQGHYNFINKRYISDRKGGKRG